MKQIRLLLLMLLFSIGAIASAQDGTDTDQQVVDTPLAGDVYLKNVATGLYWGAGHSWGTQASLNVHPEYLTLVGNDDGTYKIDSRVTNGGDNHYFNGDFMDNNQPMSLTITEVDGGYTIASPEGKLFGYDGTSTLMGKDVTDKAAAVWQIIKKADMAATLGTATADAPVDASFMILDQNFGRNNRDQSAWVVAADPACKNKNLSGGNNENNCAESFHSLFKVSQVVAGLPKGLYKVSAQAFYRNDAQQHAPVVLPHLFANTATVDFPVKDGNEGSMSDASVSFAAGKYTISTYLQLAADGDIEVGVLNQSEDTLWCIWDNIVLEYYGAEADLATVMFGEYVKQIAALMTSVSELSKAGLPDAVTTQLEAVLTQYEDFTSTDEQAYKDAIAALTKAKELGDAYVSAKAALAKMEVLTQRNNIYTAAALDAYYTTPLAAYEAGTLTADEAKALQNPYQITGWHANLTCDDLLLSAWDVDGTIGAYQGYYINTWSTEGENDGSNFTVPFYEYWTGDGESLPARVLTGKITNVVPGKYYVTADVRVRVKNGNTDPATGITLGLNDGDAVNVCTGAQVGTSQFYVAHVSAIGEVAADSALAVKFTVASENNISWLSFQNVKYAPYAESANLDFGADQPVTVKVNTYQKDVKNDEVANQQPVTGWNIPENGDARAAAVFAYGDATANLAGADYIAPAAAPDDQSNGKALGLVAVWGATTQYTQPVTLPAGNYVITYKAQNVAGTGAFAKNLFGFIADDGTEYLSTETALPVGQWTDMTAKFTLKEMTSGILSVGYKAPNQGSGANQHIFIDRIEVATVSDAELAKAALQTAITAAQSAADAAVTGTDLFFLPVEAKTTLVAAITEAQAVYDNAEATAEQVNAAKAAIETAKATFDATPVNQPAAGQAYTFIQKASGLALSLVAPDAETEGDLGSVQIAETASELTFEPTDGGFYLTNGTEYVGIAGTNNWTMAAAADKKAVISVAPVILTEGEGDEAVEKVYYTLSEPKGMIATDATDAGSACYSDKSVAKSGDKAYWTIAPVAAPQPEDYIVVAGAKVPVVATIEVLHNEYEKTPYSETTESFDLEAVKTALGVEDIATCKQYIVNCTDSTAVDNTTDGWRNAQGDAEGWGTSAGMVCVKINDPASATINYIGCIDDTWTAGQTCTAKWAFVSADASKAAVVSVKITFIEQPPVTVGEYEKAEDINVEVTREPGKGYDADEITADLTAIATAIGLQDLSTADAYVLDAEGNYVGNAMATYDGWFDALTGAPTTWSTINGGKEAKGVCLKWTGTGFNICDMENKGLADGDKVTVKWAFANAEDEKLVVVNFNVTYKAAVVDGIRSITALQNSLQAGKVYNLRGQKAGAIVKGGVYLVDGKKVLVK